MSDTWQVITSTSSFPIGQVMLRSFWPRSTRKTINLIGSTAVRASQGSTRSRSETSAASVAAKKLKLQILSRAKKRDSCCRAMNRARGAMNEILRQARPARKINGHSDWMRWSAARRDVTARFSGCVRVKPPAVAREREGCWARLTRLIAIHQRNRRGHGQLGAVGISTKPRRLPRSREETRAELRKVPANTARAPTDPAAKPACSAGPAAGASVASSRHRPEQWATHSGVDYERDAERTTRPLLPRNQRDADSWVGREQVRLTVGCSHIATGPVLGHCSPDPTRGAHRPRQRAHRRSGPRRRAQRRRPPWPRNRHRQVARPCCSVRATRKSKSRREAVPGQHGDHRYKQHR